MKKTHKENNTKVIIPKEIITYLMDNLSHTAEMRFNRYGRDLQYAFFKRKSSKHTTWYVFFNRKGDRYITLYHQ